LKKINNLDAGSWKDAKFRVEKISTFAEALNITPKNVWLNIHVKQGIETGKTVAKLIMKKIKCIKQ